LLILYCTKHRFWTIVHSCEIILVTMRRRLRLRIGIII
jgi:hypothetical protein